MHFCHVVVEPAFGLETLVTSISITRESLDLIECCKCLCRDDLAIALVFEHLRVEVVMVYSRMSLSRYELNSTCSNDVSCSIERAISGYIEPVQWWYQLDG
jgi:hypothetical protein